MCVRRFLFVIFILTLMVVGGAFAIYQWGGEALVRMATPVGHYQEPARTTAPDYAKEDNWFARPGLADDPSKWLPKMWDGRPLPPVAASGRAALFYVHPTTYLQRDRWNAPLDGSRKADQRARLFVQSQASAFTAVADAWAPKYRQAAYGAFLLNSDDARKALDLAYRDVLAAFDHFIAAQPRDRIIILAGHSQGSLHLLRLLVDRKEKIEGRLAAAYVVGWPVSTTADLPATGLPACARKEQAGCVMSWQSFKEPANPDMILDAWEKTVGPAGGARKRADMLCSNPLTGTPEGNAPRSANNGTLVPNGSLTEAKLEPGRVGAKCEKGFLMIDGDIPDLGPYVLPGKNYHVYDYALFWGAIEKDAIERSFAAWSNSRGATQ